MWTLAGTAHPCFPWRCLGSGGGFAACDVAEVTLSWNPDWGNLCSSTWLCSVPAGGHSTFGNLDQTPFQHGEWFPREPKQKPPCLLRAKPRTRLVWLLPQSSVKVSHKSSPGSRRGEVASHFFMKETALCSGMVCWQPCLYINYTLPKVVRAYDYKPNSTNT